MWASTPTKTPPLLHIYFRRIYPMSKAMELARHLETLHINNMYKNDFYWTWDKTDEELDAIFHCGRRPAGPPGAQQVHPRLRLRPGHLHLPRQTPPVPGSPSPPPAPCWGLEEQVLDEKVSQIAHGEDRPRDRPTWSPSWRKSSASATICSSARATSIRRPSSTPWKRATATASWSSGPTLVNLQCDVDHPTQCMADMLHIIHYFGAAWKT